MSPMTDDKRIETLWSLYDALLAHLLATLNAPDSPAKGSTLDVARKFLADNRIGLGTSRPASLRKGLQSLADIRALPFDKDGKKVN